MSTWLVLGDKSIRRKLMSGNDINLQLYAFVLMMMMMMMLLATKGKVRNIDGE